MVSLARRERETLTGRVRGRPRKFGRLLTMQVEVKVESADAFDVLRVPPPPNCVEIDQWEARDKARIASAWKPTRTIWRDATWEDQMALLEQHND